MHDDRPELSREDQEFIERMAASFEPAPMNPARRVAFDEALRARLERPRRRRILVPAFAAAAVTAAVVFLVLSGRFEPFPTDAGGEKGVVVAEAETAAQWEYELVYLDELARIEERDDSELLPDDYLAISSVFLSG
jgi:hypothetical protein